MSEFNEDIFVIDCWLDNETKENDITTLINRIKIYNIPIVLTTHLPVRPEIQEMVDYYLYDKNNPLLNRNEFEEYKINSTRWSQIGEIRIENHREFHHDYAIWESMRNAFNFCKFLDKKYIHFMEYDNLPDEIQYRQAFLEEIRRFDAVIYEYNKGSSKNSNPYCATYIFSIKTDIAVQVISTIKNKDQFFRNKPDSWQLEKNFLNSLRTVTNNIYVSKYIPNNNELNTRAMWNRDDIYRNGVNIQFYLAIENIDDLYLHTISGGDYLIEVNYIQYKEFIKTKKGAFLIHKIGKYEQNQMVKIYHQGIEIFNEQLNYDVDKFRNLNKLIGNTKVLDKPKQISINFIDGPFIEILNDNEKTYHVEFINSKNNFVEYTLDMKSNHWARSSKKYYINWNIDIKGIDNNYNYRHHFDVTDKRVLISLESKSLGDTLAWIPYVEKFRIDRKCQVVCSTFFNNLFKGQYPEIEFIEPGTMAHNLYALYRIGVFLNFDKWDNSKHLTDPKTEPLTKIASDILGLDYIELKPILPVLTNKKRKMVSIGPHATAQAKYWNNPTGWKEVIEFLKDNGYEVRLLSKEGYEYMGNKIPRGATIKETPKIEDALKVIQESELFIGVSSGLAWLAWGAGTETILISGFTNRSIEPFNGIRRIINEDVCYGCWSTHIFDKGDWNWCPVHKGTDRQFECSKMISSEQVIEEIKRALNL